MSEFTRTLRELARLAGKSEYAIAQQGNLDPAYVRALMDGVKGHPSPATIIQLAQGLTFCPELFKQHPELTHVTARLFQAMLADAAAVVAARCAADDKSRVRKHAANGSSRAS